MQAESDRTRELLEARGAELTAARLQNDQLNEQLANARQQAADLAAARTELAGQLAAARETIEQQRQRAELAGVRSELTAAHAMTQAEKAHGTQRLADQQTRYDELVTELRTQIDQLREQVATQRQQAIAATRTEQKPQAGRRAGKEERSN